MHRKLCGRFGWRTTPHGWRRSRNVHVLGPSGRAATATGDRSAAAPRRDDRRPGALAQRAPGHPGCEPPRLCAVLGGVPRSLSTRSEEFRIRWAAHNVRFHRTGIKRLHHFLVGDLDLTFEALELPADPGLRITTYTAEPGSPSQEGLNLRASWAATVGRLDRTETAPSTDRA